MYAFMCVYIYIHIHTHTYIYIYISCQGTHAGVVERAVRPSGSGERWGCVKLCLSRL